MAGEVDFTCPNCKKTFKITLKDMVSKRKINCPNCNGEITLLKEGDKKSPKGIEKM